MKTIKISALPIIGDVFGIVAMMVGGLSQLAAIDYEKQLKNEGEVKGYLKAGLLPKYRAIGI